MLRKQPNGESIRLDWYSNSGIKLKHPAVDRFMSKPIGREVFWFELISLIDVSCKNCAMIQNLFEINILTFFSDREIEELFQIIDKDNNGKITKSELSKFFKSHRCKYSSKQISQYVKKIDQDGDGKITLMELKAALKGCG
ncbi:calmodulin [Clonorchis sinensis]|uniref:Calmodulin n=1 Tax=Clonorchis sinensis TaxID=79923 RepID=G7YA46_CLOSI|nr:calmodulin [Clonorchis sinensis]